MSNGGSKRTWSASGKVGITVLGISLLTGAWQCAVTEETTPEALRNGWISEAVEDGSGAAFEATCPEFAIVDENGQPLPQANEKANVRQWEFVREAAGIYPRPIAQQSGDCSSWSGKHAIEIDAAGAVKSGLPAEFAEVHSAFQYGVGRVLMANRRFSGRPGCAEWYVAKGARDVGVLRLVDGPPYNGQLADRWGESGPPAEYIAKASATKIKTVSPIRNGADARDAICNGYGVGYAGKFGSKTMRPRDGRIVAVWDSSWSHAMCIDAFDGSGDQAYFHFQNSWGPTAHPKPIDDSPAGGFWVTFEDTDKAIRNADPKTGREWPDTWAYSGFDGFPARDLNFSIVGRKNANQE